MEVVCIIEWNHVYTLEILNILCDPRYSILHLHLPYRIHITQHYNTTVKYVHFTMFYTGDGNDLIYPRCVPCSKFMDWVQLGHSSTIIPEIVKLYAVQTICINLVGKLNKQFRSSGFPTV